jgi:hypothetical protein
LAAAAAAAGGGKPAIARITPFKISKEAVAEEKKVAKRKRETSAKKGELREVPTGEIMLCIAMILWQR